MSKSSLFSIDVNTEEGRKYLKKFYGVVIIDGLYYRKCPMCSELKELDKYFKDTDSNKYFKYCSACRRKHSLEKFVDNLFKQKTESIDNLIVDDSTLTKLYIAKDKVPIVRNERSNKTLSKCTNSPLWFLAFIGLRGLYQKKLSPENIYSLLCKLGLNISTKNLKEFEEIIESEKLFFPNVRYFFHIEQIESLGCKLLKKPLNTDN